MFRHPRGRKIAIIPKLLQIKIWNFLTFIIWLSSKNWCHYYFVGCHLWRHNGHQRGTGRRRNYNFLTVHSIKQDIHFLLLWKCVFSTLFMFLKSGNSMVTLSELYHHRFTSKIQFEPEVLELQGYPSFSLVEFYNFTYIYVFEVEEFNGDTFNTLPPLVDLENPVWTGNTGTLRLPICFSGGIL